MWWKRLVHTAVVKCIFITSIYLKYCNLLHFIEFKIVIIKQGIGVSLSFFTCSLSIFFKYRYDLGDLGWASRKARAIPVKDIMFLMVLWRGMDTPRSQQFLFCNMLHVPYWVNTHTGVVFCGPAATYAVDPRKGGIHCCPLVCQALPGGPAPIHWHPSKGSGPWAWIFPPQCYRLHYCFLTYMVDITGHITLGQSLWLAPYLKPISSYYLGYY